LKFPINFNLCTSGSHGLFSKSIFQNGIDLQRDAGSDHRKIRSFATGVDHSEWIAFDRSGMFWAGIKPARFIE